MYIVLSPAKRLHTVDAAKNATEPFFWKNSRALARHVQSLTVEDLEKTMKISPKLGALNFERFQNLAMTSVKGTPAIRTFAGDTYIGMDTNTLQDGTGRIGIVDSAFDRRRSPCPSGG